MVTTHLYFVTHITSWKMHEHFLLRYLYFSFCSLFIEIIEYIKALSLIYKLLDVLLHLTLYKEVYIMFIKWLHIISCVSYHTKTWHEKVPGSGYNMSEISTGDSTGWSHGDLSRYPYNDWSVCLLLEFVLSINECALIHSRLSLSMLHSFELN